MQRYEILVRGVLEPSRGRWFPGLTMTPLADGNTMISGRMDQAALHGVLSRVRDLGLVLVSVKQVEGEDSDGTGPAL